MDASFEEALAHHPNYIMMMGWAETSFYDAEDFYAERRDLIDRALRPGGMGYRLVPLEVICPAAVPAGSPLTIQMTWANQNNGRCTSRYPLAVRLTDASGKGVFTFVDKSFDPTSWVRGAKYGCQTTVPIPESLAAGKYNLCLAILESEDSGLTIDLGIRGRESNGFYKMGSLSIGKSGK